MLRAKVLILILIFTPIMLIPSPYASEDEQNTSIVIGEVKGGGKVSRQAMNGRGWMGLPLQAKITFLAGLDEGFLLTLKQMETEKRSRQSIADLLQSQYYYTDTGSFLMSELAGQVDSFYADTANVRVPVVEVYRYVYQKVKGAMPEELARSAAELRRTDNK